VAIEAGILDRAEILRSLEQVRQNVHAAGASSIGLTLYPPTRQAASKIPA